VIEQIGGWATDGADQSYGSSYPLKILQNQMAKVILGTG
jgi:hypothetical protein